MEKLFQNHPTFTVIMLTLLTISFIVIVLTACLNSDYKEKIKTLEKKIKQFKNERKAWLNLTRWHMNTIKELRQSNDRHMVKRINQGIQIEGLKDELKDIRLSSNIMPYVEDMSSECFTLLREKKQLSEALKLKVNQCDDLKKAFTEASEEIKHQTEYSKKIEADNKVLRQMYEKVVAENEALNERLRLNELKFKHEKITPKPKKETGYWKCSEDKAYGGLFIIGEIYPESDIKPFGTSSIRLIRSDKSEYIVNKSDFTIAPKPEKCVKEHMQGVPESGK